MKQTITRTVWALLLALTTAGAWAQTNLTGRVTDAGTKEGMPGVNIIVKGRSVGTTTDSKGRFQLNTTVPTPLTLVFSSVGYTAFEEVVNGSGEVNVELNESFVLADEVVVSASRVEESITKAAVTVEKLSARQFQQSPAATPFDALQNIKGVDLLTQSLSFKSVNIRGFGANNNNRFVQLTDGMDNRSPGLGFGFGTVAGVSDLDIESIEIIPGASSALYGPDALQGLMLTTSKNPFTYQGLSAQVKIGANNFGKDNFGPKLYTDVALRYAKQLGDRFAFKVNFQRLDGTDFVADDYSDRYHRGRDGFFTRESTRNNLATGIGYAGNNDPNTNFQYDGVNIYGDDFNNASAFRFPANHPVAALRNQLVTRTGYTEIDLLGNNGKVFNTRTNASLHYKVTDKIEASIGWYYGNGNFIRTAGFREYFPNYHRHQIKAELRGDNFFLRAYTTQQRAEGWNIGQTAVAINNAWKPLNTWAADFATAYAANGGNIGAARNTANAGRYAPGSAEFNRVRDLIAGTWTNETVEIAPGVRAPGRRFRDNSQMFHYEGMYNFKNQIKFAEIIAGASLRRFLLESGGTSFPRKPDGSEFTINEYGAYVQASKEIRVADVLTVKPTVAVRYDKNQYFKGGFTPRASAVVSIGQHNFRGSWQSAFRNPSPGQLLAFPARATDAGEVGGSEAAVTGANLIQNRPYFENDVQDFLAGRITEQQLRDRAYVADPNAFTTEKIRTWEVGYKTLLNNRLFVDAFLYRSRYTDFIAAQNMRQPLNGQIADLRQTSTFRTLQVNFNNFNEIFVNGWGLGLDYALGAGFTLGGNYARQVGFITSRDARGNINKNRAGEDIVKRRMSDPDVADFGRNFFISPENRYNVSFGNPRLKGTNLGFNVTYRWTDRTWVEQGTTAGDIWLPSWTSLDAQVSYRVPKLKSIVKLGGSNILNQYYAQGYGLARVGGLYYLSLTFDELGRL
ncbi:TonB-dependent receptor [Tellurirhabdus rosea]|uniref:TonB-dependent receptor n=1 Tax=Tellurirhabdus rosea TaxID=2674997 RepID=UPI002256E574|nr:TonB-dependent receptor [Tellurirhabdus rosea]